MSSSSIASSDRGFGIGVSVAAKGGGADLAPLNWEVGSLAAGPKASLRMASRIMRASA